jgi:hypothetical protein
MAARYRLDWLCALAALAITLIENQTTGANRVHAHREAH